jgi:thiamine monophosphate synthase
VGLDGLERAGALARQARCPLVAIGGIDLARAPAVARHATHAAVIAELVAAGTRRRRSPPTPASAPALGGG